LLFLSVDPKIKVNQDAPVFGELAPVKKELTREFIPSGNVYDDLDRCVQLLEDNDIDLTFNYADWVNIGFAFTEIGEAGRYYFDKVSAVCTKYDPESADKQFDFCLRADKEGKGKTKTRLRTFFKYCQQKGIDTRTPKKPLPVAVSIPNEAPGGR